MPNIENPSALVSRPVERPEPVGFGPVARSWLPRRTLAGTYDEAWCAGVAPHWPADLQPRFLNAASAGLVSSEPLQGGAAVELVGLHPDGAVRFTLPRARLQAKFEMKRSVQRLPLRVDGVYLQPDEAAFTLYSRAALRVGDEPFAVERVVVRELFDWEDP